MNTQDVDIIGEVLRQALEAQRAVLETLIEVRTRDAVDAERATALASEACEEAEQRLRDFMTQSTSNVADVLRHAAAEDVARLHDELHQRERAASQLESEVLKLQQNLADISGALATQPSADDILARLAADEGLRETLRGAPGKDGGPGDAGAPGAGIDAPVWAPGIYRAGTTVQAYFGQFYRARKDTNAEPYGSDDWERIGTAGFHHAEPYTEGRTYAHGDLFVRDFGTFVQSDNGAVLLAGRGPRGEPGTKGTPGKDGAPGKDGRHGAEVTGIEVRGAALALILRRADGTTDAISADLIPLLEKLGELVEQRVIATLARSA